MNIYKILTKWMGWTPDSGAAPERVCVILGVPHTSILDSSLRTSIIEAPAI